MRRLRLGMMAGGGISPAAAFLAAAGITDPTITAAINTLVSDLVGYGIWNKMLAIYPFVGGTAVTHKFNLKDPRDLDAAFRLAFSGGLTHNANGVTGNGVNGTANTFFNPAIQGVSLSSFGMGVYSRTNSEENKADIAGGAGAETVLFALRGNFGIAANTIIHRIFSGLGTLTSAGATSSLGYYSQHRIVLASINVNQNTILSTKSQTAQSITNTNITLIGNSGRNYAFAYLSEGLSTIEDGNLRTAVQAFQTTLGRQV